MKADAGTLTLLQPPKIVGYWCFGGNTRLAMLKRPRWLTRFLMKWLVEWTWEDEK